jgi:hypothetical protein
MAQLLSDTKMTIDGRVRDDKNEKVSTNICSTANTQAASGPSANPLPTKAGRLRRLRVGAEQRLRPKGRQVRSDPPLSYCPLREQPHKSLQIY